MNDSGNSTRHKRTLFLSLWDNLYPAPPDFEFCGRLIRQENSFFLERNGIPHMKLLFHHDSALQIKGEPSKFRPEEVFIPGDWIYCRGAQAGQTLKVLSIGLLSPNLLETEPDLKVATTVREWNYFLRSLREFFFGHGFIEINTPTLVTCPGTEPFIEPFETTFQKGSTSQRLFLPFSPEIHLKKVLARGLDKIFEIRPCFRNGELSPLHQPEFYMLEWYQAFCNLDQIEKDLVLLINSLRQSYSSLPDNSWTRKSVAELFETHLGFQLKPETTAEELCLLARAQGVDIGTCEDFDDVFFFIFLEKIEPHLKEYGFLTLYNYPPSQAALARLTPEGWGDRFEFYIDGIELANAYNELNNPCVQRLRSQADLQKRAKGNKKNLLLDEDFFDSLKMGMPPSAGIALGLDRLFMLIMKEKDLKECRTFPFHD